MEKRTKIVATIGPASESKTMLAKLMRHGIDCCRLNFSHGTHAQHRKLISSIRAVSRQQGRNIAIMQDLQGPRIRVSQIKKSGIDVKRGEEVALYPDTDFSYHGEKRTIIPLQIETLARYVKPDDRILLSDGLIELTVLRTRKKVIIAKVVRPGTIFSNKGLNVPDSNMSMQALTPKDKQDLRFGQKLGVDWISLSFVNKAKDVADLRRLIRRHGPKSETPTKIMAKIETRDGLGNFDEILELADGIMVARGDLGIELPAQNIPIIQKELIVKCLRASKPVVVATQMLESMIANPRPTRAEVSDVANAVIDHADGVMLSAETAVGRYPDEAVTVMADTIRRAEESPYDDMHASLLHLPERTAEDAVAESAFHLAKHAGAKAIVVPSLTGRSARLLSRYRPETAIVALTKDAKASRQLALSWGVYPQNRYACTDFDTLGKKATKVAKSLKLASKGDAIIIATGYPCHDKSGMNTLKIQKA